MLTTNGPKKLSEDREWDGPDRGSKRGRVLVVGRRVAVNKTANGKDSGFRLQENNCVRKKGKTGSKKLYNANKQSVGVKPLSKYIWQNCISHSQWSANAHSPLSPAPRPTSRSGVLCRPVAMTGCDSSAFPGRKENMIMACNRLTCLHYTDVRST